MTDGGITHDAVLVFAKTWGAIYILGFFLIAVAWTYWPSKKKDFDEAAKRPLQEDDKPWR